VTVKTCYTEDYSYDLKKNQLCITEMNYILQFIKIENCYFTLERYLTILQFVIYHIFD